MLRVCVVGAGVIGLTTAVRLREAGFDVRVLAREPPPETTSAVAAALWYPYRALPYDRVTAWSAESFQVFEQLAATDPAAGVTVRWGTELLRAPAPDPWWRAAVPAFQRLAAGAVPRGYAEGWRFPAPVADTSRYLSWLLMKLDATGGTLTRREVTSLEDAFAHGTVVVNCAGLGARELVPDALLAPVRGQVVYVAQCGVTEWALDEDDPAGPTYVVPRERDIVCGGTAEEGAEDTTPDPDVAESILARCRALVPALRDAPVLGHRAGLRPTRPAVRLETEHRDAGPVVHCYGHGGAGVTLSWGCAAEVVRAVRAAAAPLPR
jgi:D-amino-acid oxidase